MLSHIFFCQMNVLSLKHVNNYRKMIVQFKTFSSAKMLRKKLWKITLFLSTFREKIFGALIVIVSMLSSQQPTFHFSYLPQSRISSFYWNIIQLDIMNTTLNLFFRTENPNPSMFSFRLPLAIRNICTQIVWILMTLLMLHDYILSLRKERTHTHTHIASKIRKIFR